MLTFQLRLQPKNAINKQRIVATIVEGVFAGVEHQLPCFSVSMSLSKRTTHYIGKELNRNALFGKKCSQPKLKGCQVIRSLHKLSACQFVRVAPKLFSFSNGFVDRLLIYHFIKIRAFYFLQFIIQIEAAFFSIHTNSLVSESHQTRIACSLTSQANVQALFINRLYPAQHFTLKLLMVLKPRRSIFFWHSNKTNTSCA